MDERHVARLVDAVEEAFPDDDDAQREAWEFLESFMEAWDQATVADPAAASADSAEEQLGTMRRLLAACRDMLRDASGRLASAFDELIPLDPATELDEPVEVTTLDLDEEIAAEVGVAPEVVVEVGPGFVTVNANIDDSSTPERLAAVLQLPADPVSPEGEVRVQRFIRIDPAIATAHFDIPSTTEPLGLAVVFFEELG